jgi:hypothetical protein
MAFCLTYVQWVPEIAHHCPGTPFILAGTKLDLLSGDSENSVSTLKVLADNEMPPVSFKEVPYIPLFYTAHAWRSFTLFAHSMYDCVMGNNRVPRWHRSWVPLGSSHTPLAHKPTSSSFLMSASRLHSVVGLGLGLHHRLAEEVVS